MRRPANRRARTAAAVSAALHLIAVVALAPHLRRPPPVPDDGPDVAIVVPPPKPRAETAPPPQPVTAPPEPVPTIAQPAPTGRPPTVAAAPAALPASVRDWLRERQRAPKWEPVSDVVDVRANAPVVIAAAHTVPAAPSPTPAQAVSRAAPVTAALVLDVSGTMGRNGRLTRARAALLAALDRLPDGSKVVVVVYSGRATTLLPGGAIPADAAAHARVESALRAVAPAGASDHAAGVRLALKFAPDEVILFTDAADEELAGLAPLWRGAGRAVRFAAARAD